MGAPLKFEIRATDGDARMGRLITPHGEIATPCFMPVGTRAAVKAMAPDELWGMGYRLVLANAYHLAVRPAPSWSIKWAESRDSWAFAARFSLIPAAFRR